MKCSKCGAEIPGTKFCGEYPAPDGGAIPVFCSKKCLRQWYGRPQHEGARRDEAVER